MGTDSGDHQPGSGTGGFVTFLFDTLHFLFSSGGPSRVTQELISSLRLAGHDVHTTGLQSPAPADGPFSPSIFQAYQRSGRLRYSGRAVFIAGEVFPRSVATAFHAIIIHDTFAFDQPKWTTLANQIFQNVRLQWARRYADAVIVPSPEVAARLTEISPSITSRVVVVPWGISTAFRVAGTTRPQRNSREYWIASGDPTPRKGLNELLSWYKGLDQRPELLLIGQRKRIDLPRGARFTGHLEISTLAESIADASAFFSFSHDEGFGLLIAEAAATGTRVIAREFPGSRRRFGNSIDWFKTPEDIKGLLRRSHIHGHEHRDDWTTGMTWERTAGILADALEKRL